MKFSNLFALSLSRDFAAVSFSVDLWVSYDSPQHSDICGHLTRALRE